MSIVEAIVEVVAIGIPELLGESITRLVVRGGRGRWQRVAMGDRKRAEREVRFLRRNHISAWIRPASGRAHEVIVRTSQADVARAFLEAPGSGHPT